MATCASTQSSILSSSLLLSVASIISKMMHTPRQNAKPMKNGQIQKSRLLVLHVKHYTIGRYVWAAPFQAEWPALHWVASATAAGMTYEISAPHARNINQSHAACMNEEGERKKPD